MTNEFILKKVDHTLLKQTATTEQIMDLCDDAIRYGVASVCIPPSFVKEVKDTYGEKLNICTVVGFPNGYNTTATKVFEAQQAIAEGANEIDMVINVGWAKQGKWQQLLEELTAMRQATKGKILKVIVETCFLSQEEKIELCRIVTQAQADFIKTSTGFGGGGATREDVKIFAENVGEKVKIKASGGIKTLQDAQDFIQLGCERLGTSSIVATIKTQEKQ